MNCTKCDLEITINHDKLECLGLCGHKFHLTCLTSANKAYKKSLINAIHHISNLLWFCDDCLPNITAAFSSDATTQQLPNQSQQNLDTHLSQSNSNSSQSSSLVDLVSLQVNNSSQPQQPQQIQIQSTPTQTSSLADLVSTPLTISAVSARPNDSDPMDTDENPTSSAEGIEINSNGKRRRLSTNSVATATTSTSVGDSISNKFTSTNYRCIYLTPFKPSANGSNIIDYAISKNRDATEIMECKKLLPEKHNPKKMSFVSFKLTVHKEFYDSYIDQAFWPQGVTVKEFVVRQPKIRPNSSGFRVNPFAIRRPPQFKPNQLSPNITPSTHYNPNSKFIGPNSLYKNQRGAHQPQKFIYSSTLPHNRKLNQNQKNQRLSPQRSAMRSNRPQKPQRNGTTPFKGQQNQQSQSFMGLEQMMALSQMLNWQLTAFLNQS